jgi:hypothetical protein
LEPSSGERVMRCTTPFAVLGPYSAAPGPSTTSMRAMSASVDGTKFIRFTCSDGMLAMR